MAYARISRAGVVDASRSKAIAAANVYATPFAGDPDANVYCFKNLGFTPKNVVVTPINGRFFAWVGDTASSDFSTFCPQPGSVLFVAATRSTNPGGLDSMEFYVAIN